MPKGEIHTISITEMILSVLQILKKNFNRNLRSLKGIKIILIKYNSTLVSEPILSLLCLIRTTVCTFEKKIVKVIAKSQAQVNIDSD